MMTSRHQYKKGFTPSHFRRQPEYKQVSAADAASPCMRLKTTGIPKNVTGFTLIEVVVALFIFALLMSSVSGIFASTFLSYKVARSSQRDTENAQYAMNTMAKELRTSSIVSSSATVVRFYDYSQDICFSYRIQNGNLEVAKLYPVDPTLLPLVTDKLNFCASINVTNAYTIMTTGVVTGNFSVIASVPAPASVGKVTISLQIAEGTKHAARLQTTASLRDYSYTGI